MPLLTSPIDGAPMRQIKRYGIEIDVCPTTGGIWLDKGELEKLMAILKEETMETPQDNHAHNKKGYPSHGYRPHYDDDDDYKKDYRYSKKSKASRLLDIFDF